MKIAAARPFIEILPAGRAQTLTVFLAKILIGKLKQDIRTEKLVQIQQIPFFHQDIFAVILLFQRMGEFMGKTKIILPPYRRSASVARRFVDKGSLRFQPDTASRSRHGTFD